jgi:hypothetical protein
VGVGSDCYETYENLEDLDEKFRKIMDMVLKLKPRDMKKVGISKQTLWNTKNNIKSNFLRQISTNTKSKLLRYILNFNC